MSSLFKEAGEKPRRLENTIDVEGRKSAGLFKVANDARTI